uniref:Peptidase C45 hydrolase domain-containing protein n=1 Tax=Musa acuminata subsp. malaccensis TaxID=214687 RepID=A0A804L0L3_MUSAM
MEMDSSSKAAALELFDVGPCEEPFRLGYLVGRKFSSMIQSRAAADLVLQRQLLPFARTPQAEPLIQAICSANRQRFPAHWEELLGTAEGSGVPVLHIILLNFRKEILPFIPKEETTPQKEAAADDDDDDDDCSDVLVVNDSMAIAAHNEDANTALLGHTYLVRARLPNGASFTAYTYAGELPSCAFGFNSNGIVRSTTFLSLLCMSCCGHKMTTNMSQAFTLNSVPPRLEEIIAGGIGRNLISRDLLEATSLEDSLDRICSCNTAVGHSYNLVDVISRRILNVETASKNRFSIHEVGKTPFFHANMYLHLQVEQMRTLSAGREEQPNSQQSQNQQFFRSWGILQMRNIRST